MNCRSCSGDREGDEKACGGIYLQLSWWKSAFLSLHSLSSQYSKNTFGINDPNSTAHLRLLLYQHIMIVHLDMFRKLCNFLCLYLPESPIKRSVPADERTRGKQQKPQHGQTKIYTTRWIHTEPGQAAKHVHEECACMDWQNNNNNNNKMKTFGVIWVQGYSKL